MKPVVTPFIRARVNWLAMLVLLAGLALSGVDVRATDITITEDLLEHVEAKYGKDGRKRLEALVELVKKLADSSEMEKVVEVNDFYNKIPYKTDLVHWKKKDYWATPIEQLASGAGDCEDYAIAKYFTLKELGVPEERMRIMYVQALRTNEPHMVMTYFPDRKAVPLVLDSIDKRVLSADKRKDLIPVYSFNGTGLWLAKARGTGQKIGDSERISLWTDLMRRMDGSLP